MSILHKIAKNGWCYTFSDIFNRVVPDWLFRCRRFVIYELDPDSLKDRSPTQGLTLSWCSTEPEIDAAARFTYFDQSTSTGDNAACQAFMDETMVGAFWCTGDFFDESGIGIRFVLEPTQYWLFAAYVDPKFRNSGTYTSILQFVLSELKQKGIKTPLVSVNPDNLGSNHIHRKYAASSPGTVLAIRFLKFAVCFASGTAQPDCWLTMNCRENPIKIQIK